MKKIVSIVYMFCYLQNISVQAQNSWIQKANFGGVACYGAVSFSIGTRGYVGLGVNGGNSFWEYDPGTDAWTQKANFTGNADVFAAGFSIGTKGYVCTSFNSFVQYNPATNVWTTKANFIGMIRTAAVGFSLGNMGYVGAGFLQPADTFFNDFYRYNPATDSWSQAQSLPGSERAYATSFVIGGYAYVCSGAKDVSVFNDIWRFDGSSWSGFGNFPGVPRYGAIGFSIGNKGYLGVGRSNGSNVFNDFWEYDPSIVPGTWTQQPNFAGSARSFVAGFAIGNKGYVGTGLGGPIQNDFWEFTPCIYPVATITAGGPTTFCAGSSVSLSANTGAGLTYQWKKDGTNITGATASAYSATSSGSYTVQVTSCGATLSTPVAVTVDPLPSATIVQWQWQNTIGGTAYDYLYSVTPTTDGGYICGGNSNSNISGDKSENCLGVDDYWLVKLNATGNIQWQNTIGGSLTDKFYSVHQTTDGGFICGGYSSSNISGDKTENSNGGYDYWIIKLNSSGNIQWQNTIGGSNNDYLESVFSTTDGGFICGGYSFSGISGDKTENVVGSYDYWIVKLDASGNIQWQNTIGGSDNDRLYSIEQTPDGGYILGGLSASNISGDKTENSMGNSDYWVIKLDAGGIIQWQNTIGGSNIDELHSISQTDDGGYICGGWSSSNISGDKTENSNGSIDWWVVKLDASGNVQWQNTIGGSSLEYLYTIFQSNDGGYICGGPSSSNISGDKTENSLGNYDCWVIKLDASGNIQWQNTIGGAGYDYLYTLSHSYYGGYICGAFSSSNISGDKTENSIGGNDWWMIKLSENPSAPINICSGESQVLSAKTGAGYSYQWKKNGTDISGATNQNYTANMTGSYTVVVTNSCGPATSSATTLNVNALPSATITPAGPTTFCSGGSVVLNAPVAANRSYQWKKGANLISGATLSSYTATTGGNYKVIVTNTVTGCSKTTANATTVTVNALPAATITPQGPTTFCAGGSVVLAANTGTGLTYKWKKGNGIIASATMQNYTATTAGTYKVIVTNANSCSKTSAGVTVSVPCKDEEIISSHNSLDFTVYPNPNSGEFTIKFSTKLTFPIQIELTDELGKVVKKFEAADETILIKELNLAEGIYCLTARNDNDVVIKKINIVR